MDVIRKVAVAALVFAAGTSLAAAAEKDAVITGDITPGIYGRVDMSKRQHPTLVFEQAMFVERPDTAGLVEPLYVHVPPEHAKNWKKFCNQYQGCDRPTFFIKSAEYEPGYQPPKPEAPAPKAKRKFRNGF